MSLTPGVTSAGTNPPGISDVVGQDDLTRWAQLAGVLKYLTAPLDPPPAPTASLPIATGVMAALFQNNYAAMRQAGAPHESSIVMSQWWMQLLGNLGSLAAAGVQVVALFLVPAAQVVLEGLGALRSGLDPAVGLLAQEVLTEFLGVEVGVDNLPLGIGGSDHLARARAIGGLLVGQLESEFAQGGGGALQPSIAAAQTFSGLAVNFGLASGIMGLIGGMVPYGHWDELRELGEEVARNVGLGRLVRQALMPLVHILVALPATWYYNTKYLPAQFTEGMLVNPFLAATLPHDQLYNAMHLLGYSDDKIQAFIQMHQKKLGVHEVKLLVDAGLWDQQTAQTYIQNLGYPQELATTVLEVEEVREERGWYTKLVDDLERAVLAGALSEDEFAQIINGPATGAIGAAGGTGGTTQGQISGLPFSQGEKDVIIAIMHYKLAAKLHKPQHALSPGEMIQAFEAGLMTASDLTDRWTAWGVPEIDQNIRLALLELRLNHLTEAEKHRQTVYQLRELYLAEKAAGGKPAQPIPPPPIAPYPLT